ncbi:MULTISPECIES: hypothetical protein [unclassified Clostridium]|uniref:hypothetical protein n=1 Tax=unclassified Clostridium TaxID=2614128 RepID=UPI000297B7E1|nr:MULTISPECIES: hypothetical protein [unclassified Clostridium]EKQ57985.1 MAG: hypothetical protein A370_00335 [Clostridium sp. Maddingley MBC34-26]
MGNIIKIIMYTEIKREKHRKLKFEALEQTISKYNNWLKESRREDKVENYEQFLRAN